MTDQVFLETLHNYGRHSNPYSVPVVPTNAGLQATWVLCLLRFERPPWSLPRPLLASNMSYSPRTTSVTRKTNETSIQVTLNLDATPGSGILQEIDIKTGVGFLDHVRRFHRHPLIHVRLIRAFADASCPRKAWWVVLGSEM